MTHTAEEVREWGAVAQAQAKMYAPMKGAHEPWERLAAMLIAYADLLEQRAARVTDDVARSVLESYLDATNGNTNPDDNIAAMRAALEAVWPMAAEHDRFRETSRRKAAVEAMLADGWNWNGEAWVRPPAEPQVPNAAKAWRDGGEGYWNKDHDVFTSPIDIDNWGARIECHGRTQADAEALRAQVLAMSPVAAEPVALDETPRLLPGDLQMIADIGFPKTAERVRAVLDTQPRAVPDMDEMVSRFLGWKLPENFSPDAGISFKKTFNESSPFGPMQHEPMGTNLFDADQARAMFEYVLAGPTQPRAVPDADDIEQLRVANAEWEDGVDTEIPQHVLMRLTTLGFLEVERFVLTRKGRDALAAAPQPGEPQDTALADTQRAIIEAAERRGYERGIADATKSTLEWSATLCDGEPVDYAAAEKACAELGGGWRLPTRLEMESILDLTRRDPAIDTARFPDTESNWYWTSTPCAWAPSCAWIVDFYYGDSSSGGRNNKAYVRAVREVAL